VSESTAPAPLLKVKDLKVYFPSRGGGLLGLGKSWIRAVDGVSFTIQAGQTLGIVGESGCGKSTTARAIVNVLRPTGGSVRFEGQRIDGLSSREMLPFRRDIQMIFQDPFASLNPRMTVGNIIREPMQIFRLHAARHQKLEAMRLMDLVGLDPKFINRYPHEFSGGQRQRIGIARALAVQPKLIVCDEPVSALDVSIQAQVVNLLMKLQRELGIAYLFIAHDLAVIRHIADRVGVMYLGRIVELADSAQLYHNPRHPYTQALLSAAPIPDPTNAAERQRIRLQGEIPSPDQIYTGCSFAERCNLAEPSCSESIPQLEGSQHRVACFKAEDRPNSRKSLS
jgi:oligopeptide transport system ATP-binding protein